MLFIHLFIFWKTRFWTNSFQDSVSSIVVFLCIFCNIFKERIKYSKHEANPQYHMSWILYCTILPKKQFQCKALSLIFSIFSHRSKHIQIPRDLIMLCKILTKIRQQYKKNYCTTRFFICLQLYRFVLYVQTLGYFSGIFLNQLLPFSQPSNSKPGKKLDLAAVIKSVDVQNKDKYTTQT